MDKKPRKQRANKPIAETLATGYVVDPETSCWIWQGTKIKAGYGVIERRVDGKRVTKLAHRISYEHHVGPIPDGMKACHTCDTPSCINPAHLWLGTQADNMMDMQAKGRQRYGGTLGYHRPTTFPEDRLIEIANDNRRPDEIAAELGVTTSTVYRWRAKYRDRTA